jgi:hypothetical protein
LSKESAAAQITAHIIALLRKNAALRNKMPIAVTYRKAMNVSECYNAWRFAIDPLYCCVNRNCMNMATLTLGRAALRAGKARLAFN